MRIVSIRIAAPLLVLLLAVAGGPQAFAEDQLPKPTNRVCISGKPVVKNHKTVVIKLDGKTYVYAVNDETMVTYVKAMDPREAVAAFERLNGPAAR